jgi:hypothetical protein
MTDADMALPEATAWEDGTMTVAAAPAAPAPVPPVSLTPGKKIGNTTVITGASGLRLAVTVNAFEDGVRSPNPRQVPTGRWAIVDWTIKNEGTTTVSVNRLHFKLQTTDGYVIERDGTTIREPDLDTERLGPGQIVRGWLAYDVPTGQVLKSIIYQPSGAPQFVVVDLP